MGVKRGTLKKGKRVEMGNSAGIQGANEGLLEHKFLQSVRPYNGNQQRGFHQRTKAQGGFKDDVLLEEIHSLKAQKPLSPCLLVKIYRGANSGSTWGWLLLEGVKNSDMIFGVGQIPGT